MFISCSSRPVFFNLFWFTTPAKQEKPGTNFSCLDPANYSVGKLYDGFRKLLSLTARMFSVLTRKFDLTWKDCIEKARTYLVRVSQRDDPILRTAIDKLSEKESVLELKELNPFLDESGILRSESRLA